MAKGKTNVMRLLDSAGITYKIHEYDTNDGKIDGLSAAEKIGQPPEKVFKTLVAQSGSRIYVFVIPVAAELDLKKAAQAAREKKLELIPAKDLKKQTGYIRGGCSPIGMKKEYPTFINSNAGQLNTMVISAGQVGLQIELAPENLILIANASLCEIVNIL